MSAIHRVGFYHCKCSVIHINFFQFRREDRASECRSQLTSPFEGREVFSLSSRRFMQPLHLIYNQLSEKKNIAITMHQKPDADAMGSTLALFHFLKQFGHNVTVISPTNWARWVDWMQGANEVLDYELNKAEADTILDRADWLFCLDFNHFSRTKTLAPKLFSLKIPKIL